MQDTDSSGKSGKPPLWAWFAMINLFVATVVVGCIFLWLRPRELELQRVSYSRPETGDLPAGLQPSLTAAASASGASRAPEPPTIAELLANLQEGVVLLTSYDSSGSKIGFGTGFVIDTAGSVATNFHVLRGASSADVEFHNHTKIPVKVVQAWSLASDLAIVELTRLPNQYSVLELSTNTQRPNASEVISIGHPQGFNYTTTTGIISAVYKTADLPIQYQKMLNAGADHVWLQSTAAISGGSSGGPLLDRSGAVIGVNTWVSGNYSFAIDARHLVDLRQSVPHRDQSLIELTGPDEKLAKLLEEFQRQANSYNFELGQTNDVAQRRLLLESRHPAAEYAARLCDLADECQGTPAAFDSLRWICQIAGQPSAPPKCDRSLRRATDLIVAHHLDEPSLAALLWGLRGSPCPGAWHLMEQVANHAVRRELRGVALFCAGAARQAFAGEAEHASAQRMLEKVLEEYADVVYHCSDPQHPQHLMGNEAQETLYHLKYLSIGRPAMEISGSGVDDVSFRLSDYRGKVVVVDFWVDWCPPCQQMWPQERALVNRLKDEPFALVGVFVEDQAKLRSLVDRKLVTWRNWVDGKEGSIAADWRIEAFPTIYILDHHGAIRHRVEGLVSDDVLSKWVQDLLAEVPRSAADPAP